MKNILAFVLFTFLLQDFMQAQQQIPLYEKIPGSKPVTNREAGATEGGILRVSHVSVPTLTVYQPASPSKQGTAIIICPGGGYSILAMGHEGADVARLFASWGITAFVLKYRLPDDSIMVDKKIGPLQDAQRAIQIVRSRSKEWDIDSSRIGILGFSAGGHLAATASTHFSRETISNENHVSLRPDFSILVYPVISFEDSLTHPGSRENLVGKSPGAALIRQYSNESQVTAKTPPAFLVHASDDDLVSPLNSVRYYEALLRSGVPAELHLYQKGGHGFGLDNPATEDRWSDRLKSWLKANRLL